MTTTNSRGGFVRTEENAYNDTEALRLRSQGLTYREIAARLNVDHSTAYRRVQRALDAVPLEDVTSYRTLEAERLDALQVAIWDRAIEGDLKALDRVLAIISRRAKLLGLDQPSRSQVQLSDFTAADIDREVERLMAILRDHADDASI